MSSGPERSAPSERDPWLVGPISVSVRTAQPADRQQSDTERGRGGARAETERRDTSIFLARNNSLLRRRVVARREHVSHLEAGAHTRRGRNHQVRGPTCSCALTHTRHSYAWHAMHTQAEGASRLTPSRVGSRGRRGPTSRSRAGTHPERRPCTPPWSRSPRHLPL